MTMRKSWRGIKVKGYVRKVVIYLLIIILLVPCFGAPKSYALPTGLTVTKSVELNTTIASGGAVEYETISEGDTNVAHTNILRYSYEIKNNNAVPMTVNLLAEMPTNTILFFSPEWYEVNDGRMVTGTSPLWGDGVTASYTNVSYAWFFDTGLNEYQRSIAAATTPGAGAYALEGPHTLTINNVTILANDTYTFEYAVIVWEPDSTVTGFEIEDKFYINNGPIDTSNQSQLTESISLYYFNPEISMISDKSGAIPVDEEVTYTLSMKSVGTQADMELEIPAGTTYKEDSLSTGDLFPTATPVLNPSKISFTLPDVPLNEEFYVSYTVIVNSGATSVNNTQTKVNGTAFAPINLNVSSGNIAATGYASDIPASQGIVAGQEITYTANVYSTVGPVSGTVVSVAIPSGAEFVSSTSGGIYDSDTEQINFNIASLDTTPIPLEFTLRLNDGAFGDLAVHFDAIGTPDEWKHPILVVTKSLKKDTTIAGDTVNDKFPTYLSVSDGSTVEYKDLILFIYSVKNTGTKQISGVELTAPTPKDMALYISFKSPLGTFEDADYWTNTGIIANGVTLPFGYNDLTYNWNSYGTDYARSIEAEENNAKIPGGLYAPFIVYKDNVTIEPNEEADFRYASFVNSNEIGKEFSDDFKVNGVPTKLVYLSIPGYSIDSTPAPFSSVALGGQITYTFTMPDTPAVFYADIPNGTVLVSATDTTSTGEAVAVNATVDKITFDVPPGNETRSVSYTVELVRPVKVIVNNVNIGSNLNNPSDGKYFGTITHNMASTTLPEDVVLGYLFTSDLNNSYISYNNRMTFKYYVQNNTDEAIENIVVTVPIHQYFRLDPGSIPYWFGDDAVIIDKDGIPRSSNVLMIIYNKKDADGQPDYSDYDALAPFSIQWTIPRIEAGHTESVLVNGIDRAAELSFSGNVKSEAEVPRDQSTLIQTASLVYDEIGTSGKKGILVPAETLTYYFPPRTFVKISSGQSPTSEKTPAGEVVGNNGSVYKYGDTISYNVAVLPEEVELSGASELFISSTIPAGTTLVNISVFDNGTQIIENLDDIIDLGNPGKIRIRIPNPSNEENSVGYSVEYSVKITSYTGLLQTYAIGQVSQDKLNSESGETVTTVVAASETNILQHRFTTPRSTITISKQSIVDASGTELNTIMQSIGGSLQALPVDFVITFTDSSGNEYNATMQNGDTNLVVYGLPYDVPLTITEIGTSDTVFKEITDSSGGDGGVTFSDGKYSFILRDTAEQRNLSFSIVSEYSPSGGFSSAASRNNMFEIPNIDFTSLMKYQLQDLASTQIDNGTGDGAIPISDDALSYSFAEQRFSVRPYFSMTVANAFLLDPAYHENARRYIEWHIAHLEEIDYYGVHGSIYDYYYSILGDERRAFTMEESDNTVDVYDSTDSYAALFFELLLNYYKATGDDSLIDGDILDLILQCLEDSLSKQTLSGDALLTVAKPGNYPMEFLMDNCEVYRGFVCLEELYTLIGDASGAATAADYARRIKLGIENHLYNSTKEAYDYALSNPSDIATYYYPDAIAQLFPIIFDVVEPNSAVAIKLYEDFSANFTYWTDMINLPREGETPKINRGGGASEFPNALILKAAIKMGDLKGANLGLQSVEKLYRQNGNPFPFLCYESGETALCIYEFMNEYYEMCKGVFTAVPKFQEGY